MQLSQKTEAAIASAEIAVIVRESADLQSVVNRVIAPGISVICGDPEERFGRRCYLQSAADRTL